MSNTQYLLFIYLLDTCKSLFSFCLNFLFTKGDVAQCKTHIQLYPTATIQTQHGPMCSTNRSQARSLVKLDWEMSSQTACLYSLYRQLVYNMCNWHPLTILLSSIYTLYIFHINSAMCGSHYKYHYPFQPNLRIYTFYTHLCN